MNTKDNVQVMIDAFVTFMHNGDYSVQKADDLLGALLEQSKLPVTQSSATGDDGYPDLADKHVAKEAAEVAEMDKLLHGSYSDDPLWSTPEELYKLVTTYPPVILEQLLIVAMVIHVLRHCKCDMDAETDNFEKFFIGWGAVVVACP